MSVTKIDQSRFTQHEENGGSSAARTLQEALHLPLPWWKQLFKWENNLTVAGRTVEKGWVISQQLGVALIVLILSAVAGIYWTMSARIDAKDNAYQAQRDMLIEIKTELRIQKEHEVEFRRKQIEANELQDLKIQDTKDKLLVVLNSKGR